MAQYHFHIFPAYHSIYLLLILLFFAIRGGIKLAKKETELVVINRIFVGLLISLY
jgi:hypothetical protein